VFLAGGLLVGLWFGIFVLLGRRRGASGNQTRLVGSILVYVMIFWTTTGLFSNVKQRREFWARYEPYVQGGSQQGYTFFYLDYEGRYERIDSPDPREETGSCPAGS
jgi:hypothetical protein